MVGVTLLYKVVPEHRLLRFALLHLENLFCFRLRTLRALLSARFISAFNNFVGSVLCGQFYRRVEHFHFILDFLQELEHPFSFEDCVGLVQILPGIDWVVIDYIQSSNNFECLA